MLYINTISQLFVQSKIMTRDSTNPALWAKNNTAQYEFVNRGMTYIDTGIGQIYRNTAIRKHVDFSHNKPWYFYLPVFGWFTPLIFENEAQFDLTTY